jgi:IclR family acetate operon transcriptional repressor
MSDEGTKMETGSLQRGLALLDALFQAERSLTLNEVAEKTNLSSATAHRLLNSLMVSGYVSRDAAKHYLPSMRAILPISQYHPLSALRRTAAERLRSLRDMFGLTAFFVIYVETDRYVLELIPGTDPFSPYYRSQLDTPLHGSVTGKLLLAHAGKEQRDLLLGAEPYTAATPKTILTRKELDLELTRVTQQRYAETRQEVYEGMSAIGAPILLNGNILFGALVLSGPLEFFASDRLPEAIQQLQRAADLFSNASSDIRQAARFFGL